MGGTTKTSAFYNKLTYEYVESDDGLYQSGRVESVVNEIRKSESSSVISSTTSRYTYDANGNITAISNASGVIQNKYYYDDLNQLVREDNRALNHSYTYTYDNAGNITAKKIYAFTTGTLGSVQQTVNYTYGDSSWRDLLTNYNGKAITYDAIGNPTQIGYDYLTWQGRQLKEYANNNENTIISYAYNADGIRTYKCVEGMVETWEYEYILSGDMIVMEQAYLDDYKVYAIVYLYDETGSPIGLKYRSDNPAYYEDIYDCYFFEKNLQGDIIGIYDSNGTKVVTYTYDAWGNVTVSGSKASTIGYYNPFRYRGYYYDNDTGLYYLQSRYYNPTWGRFINPDSYINANGDIIGYNMFAYCSNNPVLFIDTEGTKKSRPETSSAVELLMLWMFGDGSYQHFGNNSDIAKDFKKSSQMNSIIRDKIDVYEETGQCYFSGDTIITGYKEFDLWMGVRKCDYTIKITEKTLSSHFWLFGTNRTYTYYKVDVYVHDTYDFNSGSDAGDGLGSALNNFAYFLHEKGLGKNYEWDLSYTKNINKRDFKPIFIL